MTKTTSAKVPAIIATLALVVTATVAAGGAPTGAATGEADVAAGQVAYVEDPDQRVGWAESIDDDGNIFGVWYSGGFDGGPVESRHAARWTEDGRLDVIGEPERFSVAYDSNASGVVVGEHARDPGQGIVGFRWTEEEGVWGPTSNDLPLGGWANAVNDDGVIVGGGLNVRVVSDEEVAYRWTEEDGRELLGPADRASDANDVNNHGVIVGEADDGDGNMRAFRWTEQDGFELLGTLGGATSVANAINNHGVIVGEAEDGDGNMRAFRWTEQDGMEDLGTFGGATSVANGINDLGVIVGQADDEEGNVRAFLWDAVSSIQHLETLQDVHIAEIADINIHGVVAGTTGGNQIFRWYPEQERPGLLRVETDPPVASQISIDGEYANTWAVNGIELSNGTHEVCFGPVAGHITPECESVTVTPYGQTLVTGTFTPAELVQGTLRVTTEPPVAAQISIDGHPANNWGLWTDLDQGEYEVCFGDVKFHSTPDCQTVQVDAGETTEVVGEYGRSLDNPGLSGVGMLRVTTDPPVPSQITVNGHVADTWGLDWLELPYGEHEVCFGPVADFETPDCEIVDVTPWTTTGVVGEFAETGQLQVTTDPGVPSQISVDGIVRDGWGLYTAVPTGEHEVCFGPVAGRAPGCEIVEVLPGETSTVIGAFG